MSPFVPESPIPEDKHCNLRLLIAIFLPPNVIKINTTTACFTGRVFQPALCITLGEVVGCNREGEINVAFQSALSGVAIVETWQEVRRESNQERLTKEQEVRYGQNKNT